MPLIVPCYLLLLSIIALVKVAPWINLKLAPFNARFVKRPEDAFIVTCIFAQGIAVPLLFAASFLYTAHYGFSPVLCLGYNVIRIGPYFMNFAYCYTLCHKEGHTKKGFYKEPYNSWVPLRNVFNWWISLFFGVMPAAFAFGHSLNHHKYNNGMGDVATNADKPRDSFANFIAYLPRWTFYSLNISSIAQFLREENYTVALKMLGGCVYWWSWFAFWYNRDACFALGYVLYPVSENLMLLAAINWSWHGFMDPDDPENEYVGSITIFGGQFNVMNEDYHVVHHQYPGAHWTEHPQKLTKHWDEYVKHRATCFEGTHAFEVFALMVSRDYNELASKFVDLRGERKGSLLSHEGKVELIKARVRACSWGPRIKEEGKKVN